MKQRTDEYYIVVVEQVSINKIVASGCVLVESKFIRNCGKVGHIEDIVVDNSQRGKNLGKRIIEQLTHVAQSAGCYKVILCCEDKNIGFYEKCGYEKKEVEMVHYF
jgi:glucosamine-phosphate N-acetyltransferase